MLLFFYTDILDVVVSRATTSSAIKNTITVHLFIKDVGIITTSTSFTVENPKRFN